MKELMNVFNYGQKEYEFVVDITDKIYLLSKHKHEARRSMNMDLAKYELVMNKHSKLLELIKEYADEFPRFMKGFKRVIKSSHFRAHKVMDEEGKISYEDVRGYSYTIHGYTIGQAFLSYIIQNKNKIMDIFDYQTYESRKTFSIVKANKVFVCDKNGLVDDIYKDVELYNVTDKRMKKYEVAVINGRAYINNKKYTIHMFKHGTDWLTADRWHTNNNYELFKTSLEKYFESVNTCNDDDFEDYLDKEVQKLMVVDYEKELNKLQNFGKISLEKR